LLPKSGHQSVRKMSKKTIYVYADWVSPDKPVLMGLLYAELLRGKEIFSFEYSPEWLKGNFEYRLDPDLEFYNGIQYLNDVEKSNFGLFLGYSPIIVAVQKYKNGKYIGSY